MQRSGIVDSRLHGGHAPRWLLKHMKPMADAIFQVLSKEYSPHECIRRLADPLWFHALSNTLGFDWDSSGTTTVTTAILAQVLSMETHGCVLVGGKGKRSRQTLQDLEHLGTTQNFSTHKIEQLIHTSRITAKVDNNLIQDGYHLYHHAMVVDELGNWGVIQQGLNPSKRLARRYHWLSSTLKSYVQQPHAGFFSSQQHPQVMDLTAKTSEPTQKVILDLVNSSTVTLQREFEDLKPYSQTTLETWATNPPQTIPYRYYHLLPKRMNWNAIRHLYELQPQDFETLIAAQGLGAASLRGLALVAELIHDSPVSWNDPVKYAFTVGGKDGVPYPTNTQRMDDITQHLHSLVDQSTMRLTEKQRAFRQLVQVAKCLPIIP